MKIWTNPEVIALGIEETAYGKNLHAREANANKHHNNGAGGDQTPPPSVPVIPDVTEPSKSADELS